jgi:hypothetical protein
MSIVKLAAAAAVVVLSAGPLHAEDGFYNPSKEFGSHPSGSVYLNWPGPGSFNLSIPSAAPREYRKQGGFCRGADNLERSSYRPTAVFKQC